MTSLLGKALALAPTRTPVPFIGRAGSVLQSFMHKEDPEALMRAYGQVGTLFAIVEALFTATGEAGWKLYRKPRTPDGERTEVTSHAALDTWNTPNPFYTRQSLVECGQQHRDLVGETVIIVGRVGSSVPIELWEVRPDRVRPVPHPVEFISGYVYTGPNGEKIPLQLDEVLTMRRPNPLDPFRGLGVVQSILTDLDSVKYSADWNRNFFLNSAEPGGIIEADHEVDDEEFRRLTERWRTNHQGVNKAHRVAVLEQGQKWIDRKYSMKDMQFAELRNVSREVIREAFRFPKPMLGTVEDVNRANADAAEVVFARWLIRPRLCEWRSMLNARFLPMFGDGARDLEFDFCQEIPEDMEAAASQLASRSSAAAVFIGLGFDPVDVLFKLELPAFGLAAEPETAQADPVEEDGGPARAVAEVAQRLYQAVEGGVLITSSEGRDILRTAGAVIEGDLPEADEPEPEIDPSGPEAGPADPEGEPTPPEPPSARVRALDALLTEIHGVRREPPLPDESQPDLSGLASAWEEALAALVERFGKVKARWFDNLVGQVERAIGDGDLASLAVVAVPAGLVDDAVAMAVEAMVDVAQDAAQTLADEAASQGTQIDPAAPDRERFGAVASVMAAVLAGGYAISAAGEALRVAAPTSTAKDVGGRVRAALDALTDAEPQRVLGGGLTGAQNSGRIETMKSGPTGAVYASEVMDANTCGPCAAVHGRWLGNTDDLEMIERTYPGGAFGGYIDCQGRARCRGTVVGVWRQGSE